MPSKRIRSIYKKKGLQQKTFVSPEIQDAETQNRTADTGIFSPLLYRLSYLGINPYALTMRPLHNFSFTHFLQQTQFLPFLNLSFRKALSVFLKILRQH